MKHHKWKNICLIIFTFAFSATLFAVESFDDSMLIAQQTKKKSKKSNSNRNMNRNPNTWRPFYQCTKATEPLTSFYQQTVGIGFLYFSDIKGNLNANTAVSNLGRSNTKLQGKIGYNRTPVSEFIVGRDIWYWFKIALSYTHQGGIVVQTSPQNFSVPAGGTLKPDLTAHVRLDAAQFRVYFMCPWTMVWKNYYYEPYLSVGVGPGWQTWADIKSESQFNDALRMKVSANCVFTIDLGSKIRRAMPTYVMSFTAGCKYVEWGQVRNIGKINQQYASATPVGGTVRPALSNPLRIKTVFSFVPYVGVQFNY